MKRLYAIVRLGVPVFEPKHWAVIQAWFAKCVAAGDMVVRYESGVLADVVSCAQMTPDDLRHSVIEVYDPRLCAVFRQS